MHSLVVAVGCRFVPVVVAIACIAFLVWLLAAEVGAVPQDWVQKETDGNNFLFAFLFAQCLSYPVF